MATNVPEELRYSESHEWARRDGEDIVVGITDFAQRELGDIVYIEVNNVGQEVAAEQVFGTIEAVKTVSDLFMPVTGVILEVNEGLNAQPELVNTDPYGQGWIIKAEISNAAIKKRK